MRRTHLLEYRIQAAMSSEAAVKPYMDVYIHINVYIYIYIPYVKPPNSPPLAYLLMSRASKRYDVAPHPVLCVHQAHDDGKPIPGCQTWDPCKDNTACGKCTSRGWGLFSSYK